MKILEVIPVAKGIPTDTLTYFTGSDVSLGSVVKVPLRKKIISAIVVSAREVGDVKSELKKSTYSLRKIEKIKSYELLRYEFAQTAVEIAEYYAGSAGGVLSSIVPNIIFESADKLKIKEKTKDKKIHAAERFVIQSDDEDRYAHYKSIIREEFAKGASVFFCLPTIQDIKKAKDTLQKGIDPYTFVLHSGMSKKEVVETINKILQESHPLLIIATGGYLAIPRYDIDTIIVDKESARSYKTQHRPYLDIRNFAQVFAKKINAKIIFGDLLLRAETVHKYKEGEYVEIAPLKFRPLTTASHELVDMKTKKEGEVKKGFNMFSPTLENLVKENIKTNEHLFLFAARRGLSPSTVCADCGTIVKCNTCGAHTVLHKSTRENFFLCHRCGERRSAMERCVNCNGIRLTTLGIGSELVEEKLKKEYPKAKIFRIDADVTPTHKKALAVAEDFYNSPGSILVGTEMALLYLTEKIDNAAVVSMDTFFSIPDFKINEKVMYILLKIRALTSKKLIIQTRDTEQKLFEYALSGNLLDYFRDEIQDRDTLKYPPFSTLIKVSILGTKAEISKLTEDLHDQILPYEVDVFPAFVPHDKGKFGVNGIIKVATHDWPNKRLVATLRSLPMNISVNVDPDSLI